MNDPLPTAWPSASPPEGEYEYRLRQQSDGNGGPGHTRVGTLDAMRRHWQIVVAPIVILVFVGIGLGLVRNQVYTADGRMSVQVASPWPSGVPGAITAGSGLAAVYSRAIYAPPVISGVAKRTHLSRREVMDRLSATQVPNTGVLKVSATGESKGSTILVANQAVDQLRRYVNINLNGSSPQSQVVLREFKRVSRQYQSQAQRLRELQSLSSSSEALRRAQIQIEATAVRRTGLADAYQSGLQLYTAPLEVISRATSARSDRVSRIELFGLIGLVAGLGVGAALATAQANSRANRPSA